ncbi:MAG TPA: SUMF1/EgtB/PvdO family nonheme iron enzyme [Armatimonadota bacterium]|nr:SUMF1/EgtB/PvdO family nonheme iron enzyme [Armatimonadota bacterium]
MCDRCEQDHGGDVGCDPNCTARCAPPGQVDRRRFILATSRVALAAAVGLSGVRDLAWGQQALQTTKNALGMELTLIAPGTFRMGSEDNDDEKPPHDVTISKPFWLAVCETSNADYRRFVEAAGHGEPGVAVPSKKGIVPWKNPMYRADEQPVVCVTHDDAVAFCAWLSETEGATYRLPTEAEWEYAYRGGTTSRFYWGDEPAGREAAYFSKPWPEETQQAPGYQEIPWGLLSVLPVSCEERNAHGLCHMAGNVWEWVADWYGPYAADAQTDPIGPAEGTQRVTRGGSRFHASRVATASVRRPMDPDTCCHNRGFRVVREA